MPSFSTLLCLFDAQNLCLYSSDLSICLESWMKISKIRNIQTINMQPTYSLTKCSSLLICTSSLTFLTNVLGVFASTSYKGGLNRRTIRQFVQRSLSHMQTLHLENHILNEQYLQNNFYLIMYLFSPIIYLSHLFIILQFLYRHSFLI